LKIQLHLLAFSVLLTVLSIKINAQLTFDTISFEIPTPDIVIDTAGNNLWQIGQPHKTFFDTAHSAPNAILTDTLNDYPPNNTSSFIYIIRSPYTQTCLTCMEFWHKYDMDSLADRGIIDASYDGGGSWIGVKDSLDPHFMWLADYHASNGNYTFHPFITSGKSDGWIQSKFCWQWFLPVNPDSIIINPDSLLIRFTFISDSIVDHKEGWMIDDVVISAVNPEFCTSTKESYPNEHITVYPNPFSTEAILKADNNFKKATLTYYNSLGQLVKQVKNISGETIILQRDDLPGGLYFLQLTQDNHSIKTFKIILTDN